MNSAHHLCQTWALNSQSRKSAHHEFPTDSTNNKSKTMDVPVQHEMKNRKIYKVGIVTNVPLWFVRQKLLLLPSF